MFYDFGNYNRVSDDETYKTSNGSLERLLAEIMLSRLDSDCLVLINAVVFTNIASTSGFFAIRN